MICDYIMLRGGIAAQRLARTYRFSVNRLEAARPQTEREGRGEREERKQDGREQAGVRRQERAQRMQERMQESEPQFSTALMQRKQAEKIIQQLKQTVNALTSDNTKLKTKVLSLQNDAIFKKRQMETDPKWKPIVRTHSASTTEMFTRLRQERDEIAKQYAELRENARVAKLSEEKRRSMQELEIVRHELEKEREASKGLREEATRMRDQHGAEMRRMQQTNREERVRAAQQEITAKNKQIEQLKNLIEEGRQKYQQLLTETRSSKSRKEAGVQTDPIESRCDRCAQLKTLRAQNTKCKKKIMAMKARYRVMGELMAPPTREQSDQLRRYITYQLIAINISLQQAASFFLLDPDNPEIVIPDLVEIIKAEPFSIRTDRYHQILVYQLCLQNQPYTNGKIKIQQDKQYAISSIQHNFKAFVGEFSTPSEEARRELFRKAAEWVTMLKYTFLQLLQSSKNQGQSTISECNFIKVMKEIGIEEDIIGEMVREMALESLDLNRLDYSALLNVYVVEQPQSLHAPNQDDQFQLYDPASLLVSHIA